MTRSAGDSEEAERFPSHSAICHSSPPIGQPAPVRQGRATMKGPCEAAKVTAVLEVVKRE